MDNTIQLLISTTISVLLFSLLCFAAMIIWRMAAAGRLKPSLLLFLTLPAGQIILVYSFRFSVWTAYWVVGVLLSLAADLILLTFAILQERKTELEAKLRETRRRRELEQAHYTEVELRREELNRIRSDFRNQLTHVAELARSGEEESARKKIRALAAEINDTKENPYCSIPVVNAVLMKKAKDCADANITLKLDLNFPDRLSVEQMHLCSIYSNLLDNAIAACKQARGGDATIFLSSKADGDYLFIKSVNPSNPPPQKPQSGRGYGSRILSDIAARYGGDYQCEYRNGTFTAVTSLLAADESGGG